MREIVVADYLSRSEMVMTDYVPPSEMVMTDCPVRGYPSSGGWSS
ncbi:hypothetical protein SAMN05216264_108215 [Pseudomonas marincola]|nr:hypothetical protein SAMN05216264_108215 [Pseudomonas marincola]